MSHPASASRIASFGTTIFTEMSALAIQHNAVNLGQGFPDFAGPDFVKNAAIEAITAVIDEIAEFPNGEHDEMVDCASQALMRFRQGGLIRLQSDYKDEPVEKRRRGAAYY